MKWAKLLHWKTNDAPGLRCFSNGDGGKFARRRVIRDGNDPAKLRLVDDTWVYWPDSFGPFPDRATLAQWQAEFDARPKPKTIEERVAALEARP